MIDNSTCLQAGGSHPLALTTYKTEVFFFLRPLKMSNKTAKRLV